MKPERNYRVVVEDEEYPIEVLEDDGEYVENDVHQIGGSIIMGDEGINVSEDHQWEDAGQQNVVEQEVYEDEIHTEDSIGKDFVIEGDEYLEEEQNQELVIFKTEGCDNTMITYSITNTDYEAVDSVRQYDTIVIRDGNFLNTHHRYEIIDGYLVPSQSQSQPFDEPPRAPIPISPPPPPPPPPPEIQLCRPLSSTSLAPDVLRRRSLRQPNKLLVIYHCSFCDVAFEDFLTMKNHEATHIASGEAVMVNSNPQTPYWGTKLLRGTDPSKHMCPSCFKEFDLSSQFGKHLREFHSRDLRNQRLNRKLASLSKAKAVKQKPKNNASQRPHPEASESQAPNFVPVGTSRSLSVSISEPTPTFRLVGKVIDDNVIPDGEEEFRMQMEELT